MSQVQSLNISNCFGSICEQTAGWMATVFYFMEHLEILRQEMKFTRWVLIIIVFRWW